MQKCVSQFSVLSELFSLYSFLNPFKSNSFSATLMYGACMSEIPVGHEIIRRVETGFLPEYGCKKFEHYKNAERILAFYKFSLGLQNFKTYHQGGERVCATEKYKFRPDGVGEFWSDGKFQCHVVVEVWGHKSHVCSIHNKNPTDYHHTRRRKNGEKMTYEQVESFDRWRLDCLKNEWPDAKIIVVEMCVFQRDYEQESGSHHSEYKLFLDEYSHFKLDKKKKTEEEILLDIANERIHGFIVADFECGPELREKTENFPILFKKAMVSRDDCGPIMGSYLKKMKLLRKPKLELISSHTGRGLVVSTKLCAFYLRLGVRVTNVQKIIQYSLSTALKEMVDTACEMRYRASSMGPDEKAIGNLMKALVVSCYGKMCTNPLKMTCVKYLNSNSLLKSLYKDQFTTVEYVGALGVDDNLYEMRKKPTVAHFSSPIHCSMWILNSAKLKVLELVYEVIQPCFDPRSYCYFCTQTDSVSIVCSERGLQEWFQNRVKPEMREHFEQLRKKYFVAKGESDEAKKSKFKAGVWKEEWAGTLAIGLSSKIYSVFNDEEKLLKLSCRSVPQNCVKNVSFSDLFNVLHMQVPIVVKYETFNYVMGQMYCDEVSKCAITPYYIKRVVLDDFTTMTLNV